MKLTVDLNKVENKVLNIVEIADEDIKEALKESLEEMNTEEMVTAFEDNLALGLVQGLMKTYSKDVKFKK
ncbi:hypothetical protein [Carnobacterium jeotgali]|uniref:hypothetical protein n=1 Tax=Carnobacterium jeotgali TaxID=545534 RepID=UPI0004935817|nr:hypothetical protein [Carnobacterium jeotgali]